MAKQDSIGLFDKIRYLLGFNKFELTVSNLCFNCVDDGLDVFTDHNTGEIYSANYAVVDYSAMVSVLPLDSTQTDLFTFDVSQSYFEPSGVRERLMRKITLINQSNKEEVTLPEFWFRVRLPEAAEDNQEYEAKLQSKIPYKLFPHVYNAVIPS